jgi:hypothetical protein
MNYIFKYKQAVFAHYLCDVIPLFLFYIYRQNTNTQQYAIYTIAYIHIIWMKKPKLKNTIL